MHSIEFSGEAQIGPVIHDEFDGSGDTAFQLSRMFQYLSCIGGLVSVLNKSNTARDEFVRRLEKLGRISK